MIADRTEMKEVRRVAKFAIWQAVWLEIRSSVDWHSQQVGDEMFGFGTGHLSCPACNGKGCHACMQSGMFWR